MKGYRPPDPVIGRNGFEEAKKVENFYKSCAEISALIRRDGPWPTINRVLEGKHSEPLSERHMSKPCKVCCRSKPFDDFRVSKIHNGKISRGSTCRECERIERRMKRTEGR
jgi:hypothetical protein